MLEGTGTYGAHDARNAMDKVVERPAVARSMDALASRMNELVKIVDGLTHRLTPVLRPANPETLCPPCKDAPTPLPSPLVEMIWARTDEATIIIRRLSEMMDALEL